MDDQHVEEIGFKEIKIFDEEIGNGSYGSVHKAMCDNLLCAAKRIHTALIGPANTTPSKRNHRIPIRRFEAEFQFLQELRHPNIIQYLGMYRDSTYKQPVLLMELMEESLTDYIERATDPIPYYTQVNICSDITRALSHLHVNEIVHRDLSSNNILLSGKPCRAKLSDFGMAKFLNVRMSNTVSNTAMPGTEAYMPPEALDGHGKFKENGDVFSFGVIIVQIITRKFPHPGDRFCDTYVQVNNRCMRASFREIERRQNHLSLIRQDHQLLPIALDCLQDIENDRPNVGDLCVRLASLKDAMPYKESMEAEENPPKPATEDKSVDTSNDPLCKMEDKCVDTSDNPLSKTEDKSVNTDSAPQYGIIKETVNDIDFISISVDNTSHKISCLQEALKQKGDMIQGLEDTLEAMQLLLDVKEQSSRNLSEQNDELLRIQQEQKENLQEKEGLLKDLSQDKQNLVNSLTELKENLDAQLRERNEQVTKVQQQLEEKQLQIDSQTKQIDELSRVMSEQCKVHDQQAQQIIDKDHQIAQQQGRIDELVSEVALQATSSKTKKSYWKGKKAQVQPRLLPAVLKNTSQTNNSGTNGSSVSRIKDSITRNTNNEPSQANPTRVHFDSAANTSISQHIANDLPSTSLASTEKLTMTSPDEDFYEITNDDVIPLSTIESSQRESVAKTRMETSAAKSVTLLSDTHQMAIKTTEILQQQGDSTGRIENNHDTIHAELQKQTAKPEGASVRDESHVSDTSSETKVKKSSFLSDLFSKKKSKHDAKKGLSSFNSKPHSKEQISTQHQIKPLHGNGKPPVTMGLNKTVLPASTISQKTPTRVQQQSQKRQRQEAAAIKRMEESSERALRTLRDTEYLGVATNEELIRQSEALDRIEERQDVIDTRLSKGKQSARERKFPFSRPGSIKTAAQKPGSSGKTKSDTFTSPLHQYHSSGSKTMDDNLDRMSELLTNLEKIGRDQGTMLDEQNSQLGRIQVKTENNHDAFKALNSELMKQL